MSERTAKNIFLGWGKVTKALARVVDGEAIVLDEESLHGEKSATPHLRIGKVNAQREVDWLHRETTDFDSFHWDSILPAQVFLSPGIDTRRKFFQKIEKFERRELDEFSNRFAGKIIAVTGTDGKSTATFQLGEILRRAFPEKKIFVGGNLGLAMAAALEESPQADIAVIEVSSYQCERLQTARIDIGIILNLDLDHLDRYNSVEDYHRAKWNLLKFSKEVFYPIDQMPLGLSNVHNRAHYTNQAELETILRDICLFLSEAWAFAYHPELLADLPRLPHRLEAFQGTQGITCINDSKATTVHAAIYGLKWAQARFSEVHLLVGGREKGDDFSRLVSVLRPSDHLLIFGEAAQVIDTQCKSFARRQLFSSLKEALASWKPKPIPRPERLCLLLSPACSSFDEFSNFEERGNFFKKNLASSF